MWKVKGRDVEGKGKGCGKYRIEMWKVKGRDVEGKGKICGR